MVSLLFLHSRKLKTGNTASHVLVDFAGLNDSIMDTAVIKLLTLVVLMRRCGQLRSGYIRKLALIYILK